MKQVVLGIASCILLLYASMICLNLYGNVTRANEMENALSLVMVQTMKDAYIPQALRPFGQVIPSEEAVMDQFAEGLALRLESDSNFSITDYVCDMDKGILAVTVEERYMTPLGSERVVVYEKCLLVEQDEI